MSEPKGEIEKMVEKKSMDKTPPVASDIPLHERELFFVSLIEGDV